MQSTVVRVVMRLILIVTATSYTTISCHIAYRNIDVDDYDTYHAEYDWSMLLDLTIFILCCRESRVTWWERA